MPATNAHRGETPFRALGRDMFLVYGMEEIARMQAALGFRRPDPQLPVTIEVVPVSERLKDGTLVVVLDEDTGEPQTRRVVVDYAERHDRTIRAFDAAFMAPRVDDLVRCVRIGLRRWERTQPVPLSEHEFETLCDELGQVGLAELHARATLNGMRVPALSGSEDQDPNVPRAASASST